jgi:alpha-L-fucosidase
MNANFLLNVGPMPNGRIQPEFVSHLKEIGEWMKKNGESIYATRGGPVPPQEWGVTTQSRDGNRVYVHVLDPKVSSIKVKELARFFGGSAHRLGGTSGAPAQNTGDRVALSKDGFLILELRGPRDPIDTIIVVESKR